MQADNWADWVSSLATAGSLLLGFTILWRDHRKGDQSEAAQVVSWFVNRPDGNVDLTVTNGASRPIVNALFCLASLDGERQQAALWRIHNLSPVIGPGESRSLSIPSAEFHSNALYPSYI